MASGLRRRPEAAAFLTSRRVLLGGHDRLRWLGGCARPAAELCQSDTPLPRSLDRSEGIVAKLAIPCLLPHRQVPHACQLDGGLEPPDRGSRRGRSRDAPRLRDRASSPCSGSASWPRTPGAPSADRAPLWARFFSPSSLR